MYNRIHSFHRNIHAVICNNRSEKKSYFVVGFAENIFVVEPHSFLIIELGATFRAFGNIECLDELFERK